MSCYNQKNRMKRKRHTEEQTINGRDAPGARVDVGLHPRLDAARRALKMLTVVDEFTQENRLIRVDRRIRFSQVCRQMERMIAIHGAPEHIRSVNGPESKRNGDKLPQGSPQGECSESILPEGAAGMGAVGRHQNALHRAGQPMAERFHQ